jgi:hypothetical protein
MKGNPADEPTSGTGAGEAWSAHGITADELRQWLTRSQELYQDVVRLDAALAQGDVQLGRAFALRAEREARRLIEEIRDKIPAPSAPERPPDTPAAPGLP